MANSLRNHKAFLPVVAALMTLTVFLVCTSLRHNGLLEPLELKVYDLLRRTQRSDGSFAARIVLIGIDEHDIQQPGFDYPMPDDTLASLLEKIEDCEPRVVGVDIYRDLLHPKARVGTTTPEREKLIQVWRDNPNIIQVFLLKNPSAGVDEVKKPAQLDDEQAGAAEFGIDHDDIARRGLLFEGEPDPSAPGGMRTYATFDWRLALWYLAGESPPLGPKPIAGADPKDFELGHARLRHFHSDDGPYVNGESGGVGYLLDCKSEGKFQHLSASQVLSGAFPRDALKDAVVILGMHATSVKDPVPTPVNGKEWGIDAHAMAVDQLLRMAIRGDPQLRFAPHWVYALWTLLWSVGGCLLGYRVRRPFWGVAGIVAGVGALLVIAWIAFQHAWWAPIVPPAICWMASAAIVGFQVSYHERYDRLVLQRLFSNVASPRVVDELWGRRGELLDEGRLVPRQLQATVMFTDLKGFSKIAEKLTPEAMIHWINQLMDPMSRLVHRHNGMVKQYAGDAIMALFGVPLAGQKGAAGDACDAVCCALAMRHRLEKINKRSRLKGEPEVEMRIGICTGPLVAGSIGGRERSEYTVIGDTVNIASRLENFEKTLRDPDIAAKGCRILIDDLTLSLLDARFSTRYIKSAALTGDREVRIHGVLRGPDCHPQPAASDAELPS